MKCDYCGCEIADEDTVETTHGISIHGECDLPMKREIKSLRSRLAESEAKVGTMFDESQRLARERDKALSAEARLTREVEHLRKVLNDADRIAGKLRDRAEKVERERDEARAKLGKANAAMRNYLDRCADPVDSEVLRKEQGRKFVATLSVTDDPPTPTPTPTPCKECGGSGYCYVGAGENLEPITEPCPSCAGKKP